MRVTEVSEQQVTLSFVCSDPDCPSPEGLIEIPLEKIDWGQPLRHVCFSPLFLCRIETPDTVIDVDI